MKNQWIRKITGQVSWYVIKMIQDRLKESAFSPPQIKWQCFCLLGPVAISLCHLQPLRLSTPVIVTNWPISHNSPSCLTQHPLHHRFTEKRVSFCHTCADWKLADHPQLPHVTLQPSESKMCPVKYCEFVMLKLCPQNIYKGIYNGTPNPGPPTLSAYV